MRSVKLGRLLTPGRILVLSFLLLIALGTLLLSLPISAKQGKPLPFLDTLFTATSATCVTGLIVTETGDFWSPFGQAVIAALIQLGGLGIASASIFLMMLAGKGYGIRSQLLVKESMNLDSLKDAGRMLRTMVCVTLAVEAAGAALTAVAFSRVMPVGQAIPKAVFHAISSFNNAGFDVLGGGQSMTNSLSNPLLMTVTGLLTVVGGLGFGVLVLLWKRTAKKSALTLHAKIVLIVTGAILVSGTVFLLLTEKLPWYGALSQFISTRSAGFAFYDLGRFSSAGLLIMTMSMFVGASPGSTGGGIKTTTFFIVCRAAICIVRGRPVTAFGRRISTDTVNRAMALLILAAGVVLIATAVMCLAEPDIPFLKLLFEATSAFGTVGLTTGITASLSPLSRIVLTATMFCGRLGPVTIACTWFPAAASRVSFPEERVPIG